MIRDEATQRQIEAAIPGNSTWLAANAGSGKTRVLTDRVARLLLDGVLPEHILCLTYTKAAASEMQNRLFKRLGKWAMLDSDGLRAELDELGVETRLDDDFLREARTLFARAIETPGGLRIQTIHSFCAALLRRFPLEAGVPPQFQEMEDRAAELLQNEILEQLAEGPDSTLFRAIAPHISGDDTTALLYDLIKQRRHFLPGPEADTILSAYDLTPGFGEADLLAEVFLGSELPLLETVCAALAGSGTTDQKAGVKLAQIREPGLSALRVMEGVFLTGASSKEPFSAKIGSFPTKKLREGVLLPVMDQLEDLMRRVERARDQRLALAAASRDITLHRFAHAFLTAYDAEKERRGWLDFDDLITRARDLLSDPQVAAWVLYRLDGGIDHILVDEAQDTSPVQWDVIERLAQEFTSGEGARADIRRTIFVVGDKKQSIYSFQGADPSEFDRMRAEFGQRLRDTDAPLVNLELEYSFRSAAPILRLVDNTFDGEIASGFVPEQKHKAFKDGMPGRVDLWPVVDPGDKEEEGDWDDPVDRVGSRHHSVVLAQRIARFIKGAIDDETPLPVEIGHSGDYHARPVHAGDFLILVRSRSRLFAEIIRACKQEGLPIAGADRLKVMAELAVRDIVALLSFLATPEDDLSLATALRSPLFGLSEQQLFDLAHRRTEKYLWAGLRARREDFPQVLAVLDDLRGKTDFLRPFDLIDRILTHHKGRQLLVGRLGAEAEEGINALLSQALSYERSDIPSLTGFLQWAQADNLEIKRAAEGAGRMLRVMTVHGAKGLEAPIVILPDCGKTKKDVRDQILEDEQGALWKLRAEDQPARQRSAMDAARRADAQERDRLLYVAMTRAERWLIVTASGELGKEGDSWYEQVRRGMERSGALPRPYEFGELGSGEGQYLTHGDWTGLEMQREEIKEEAQPDLPAHFDLLAPTPAPFPETLSPSGFEGGKALPGANGDESELAMARGTAIHHLLEHLAELPGTLREQAGAALLSQMDPALDGPALLREVLAVLNAPDIVPFYAPGTLAEVPVTADLPGLGRMHGIIDRLIITPDKITAIDFKSNRTVPATADQVPLGLLRQMGAYATALAEIYPGREIETGLIWTATTQYMPLPHSLVSRALASLPSP
ncbi:MAG: double-strand break repair helicase AddA [Pelagimonas sp.]|jgi:ATP-dependent helicase/nuclease subunit A|nr:double-strand break repair helicase AddA [Pelagimonas sp.]